MSNTQNTERFSFRDVADRCLEDAAQWGSELLGKPSTRTAQGYRWGGKQGFALTTKGPKAGKWFDFKSGEHGDVIDLIARELFGGRLPDAIDHARRRYGMQNDGQPLSLDEARAINAQRKARDTERARQEAIDKEQADRDAIKKADYALRYVNGLCHAAGTWGETYLRDGRAFRGPLPADALFDPSRKHPATGAAYPALVWPIRSVLTNGVIGTHSTFLHPNEPRKLGEAPGEPRGRHFFGARASHPKGPGAVMLSPFDEVTTGLVISEGIENGLSLYADEIAPVWCTMSADAMGAFPVLNGIEALTIHADNDATGKGLSAAKTCRKRWQEAGCEVTVYMPKATGTDLNDIARAIQERGAA